MSEYEWTDEMREISGFGGSYEQACRDMVVAGVEWLDEHVDDDHADSDPKFGEYENVAGFISAENEAAEEMTDAMVVVLDESPTGAMVQACVGHAIWAHREGWDAYVEEMEAAGGT